MSIIYCLAIAACIFVGCITLMALAILIDNQLEG